MTPTESKLADLCRYNSIRSLAKLTQTKVSQIFFDYYFDGERVPIFKEKDILAAKLLRKGGKVLAKEMERIAKLKA